MLESTAGTSFYNAPEKEQEKDNRIHPKTDIFSLGLIFIELITENEIDKTQLNNLNNDIWKTIATRCNKLDPTKGQTIFNMLQKMLTRKRKERITARECLQLLGITEKVDTQDHTSYFFSTNPEKTETSNSNQKSSIHNPNPEKTETSNQKSSIHKRCCNCKTGNCSTCKCKNKDCTCCQSKNCKTIKKSAIEDKKRKRKETSSGDDSSSSSNEAPRKK